LLYRRRKMAHTSKTIIKVTTLKKRDKHDPVKLPNNKFRNKYHVSSTVNLEYTSRKDINTPAETIYNGANHTNIDMARSKNINPIQASLETTKQTIGHANMDI
jgi:hypothetical protein